MNAPCPRCPTGELDYEDATQLTCACPECGARFWVDAEGDFNGDHWQDVSGPGEEILPEDKKEDPLRPGGPMDQDSQRAAREGHGFGW